MPNFAQIVMAWLAGEDVSSRKTQALFNRNRVRGGSGGRFGGRGGGMSGTRRMTFEGRTLLSYETWPLAVRTKAGAILLNGDAGPTMNTRMHQAVVRRVIEAAGQSHAYVPFTVLRQGRVRSRSIGGHPVELAIRPEDIEVVASTPARHVMTTLLRRVREGDRCYYSSACPHVLGDGRLQATRTHTHEVEVDEHFLGECLFRAQKRLFVAGLDRNDSLRRRTFFVARLPKRARAGAVAQALAALRPAGLPAKTPRQGEWFFAPVSKKRAGEIERLQREDRGRRGDRRVRAQVPIVAASGATQSHQKTTREILVGFRIGFPDASRRDWQYQNLRETQRHGRHVAARMYCNGAVFVKGQVRDVEHDLLVLPGWHRVVKNCADGSWGVDRRGGARVD